MKRLTILFTLITSLAYAQPQLSVTNYGSYLDQSFTIIPHFLFIDIEVQNSDSIADFNDSLYLAIGVDTGTVVFMSATNTGLQVIPAMDSILIDTTFFAVDTALLKDGNNTVVIWPYSTWSPSVTKDSLFINVFITNVTNIADNEIPIRIGPNPAADVLFIYDPEKLAKCIRLRQADGKFISCIAVNSFIGISHLRSGLYLVELETEIGVFTNKLIIRN